MAHFTCRLPSRALKTHTVLFPPNLTGSLCVSQLPVTLLQTFLRVEILGVDSCSYCYFSLKFFFTPDHIIISPLFFNV